MTIIDKTGPYRNKRIKGNTQKWFDSEGLEKLNAKDTLFKNFKKSRLNIDSYTNTKKLNMMPQN